MIWLLLRLLAARQLRTLSLNIGRYRRNRWTGCGRPTDWRVPAALPRPRRFSIAHLVALIGRSSLVSVDVMLEMGFEFRRIWRIRVHEKDDTNYEQRMEVLESSNLNAVQEDGLVVSPALFEALDEVTAHLQVMQCSIQTSLATG